MRKTFFLSVIIAALLMYFPSVFAQSSIAGQQRIMESIMVNGQPAQGVLVVENGTLKSYSCDSPQPYVTTNQSESGWACFDESTGMWLLNAQPPSQATTAVIYNEPNTIYVPTYSYGDGYPYPYYSYGLPYLWGPALGLGFGFNFGHFGHGFHEGHGFHNGHGFANGGFNHGGAGFAHGVPGISRGGGFGHGGGFQGGGFHGGGFHGRGFGGHMGGGGRR
jgi:hypothetical protein